jgi:hypothetical protein
MDPVRVDCVLHRISNQSFGFGRPLETASSKEVQTAPNTLTGSSNSSKESRPSDCAKKHGKGIYLPKVKF